MIALLENAEIYMQEIMHIVAQSLMLPVMIVLILLIVFTLYCLGSVIMELVSERRYFKANMPKDIKTVHDAAYENVVDAVFSTGLLKPQKQALAVIARNMGLPSDDLFALARAEISRVDARYRRILARTELVTKIAPMMGLMCTLIPLGPGIVAMGQGDVNTLSNSLLIAFDGTVAGLVAAVVAMVISSIRKRWYGNYLVAMESLTTSILEKAEQAHKEGIELPYDGDVRADVEAMMAGAAKDKSQAGASTDKAKEE